MTQLFLATVFAILITMSCDSSFTGDGDGGFGKRFTGSGGSGDGKTPDVGNGTEGPGTGDGSNGGLPGGNLPGGSVDGGGGVDTTNYVPMTVKVHRRDKSSQDKHDHEHITLAYQVIGGTRVESGTIGNKGDSFTIQRACPPTGSVNAVIQFQLETGAKVSPTKQQNFGGPIGYRLSQQAILIGFEKEGVNNPQETAYHNNDDLVMEMTCTSSAQLIINNLCLDQRIPENGWDLVSDNITYDDDEPPQGHGAPARLCNGN